MACASFLRGSSPRMWGTLCLDVRVYEVERFIPTHVGNTGTIPTDPFTTTVHPHACGEHCPMRRPWFMLGGSSPRMWGTRAHDLDENIPARFIPTHVGNTRF